MNRIESNLSSDESNLSSDESNLLIRPLIAVERVHIIIQHLQDQSLGLLSTYGEDDCKRIRYMLPGRFYRLMVESRKITKAQCLPGLLCSYVLAEGNKIVELKFDESTENKYANLPDNGWDAILAMEVRSLCRPIAEVVPASSGADNVNVCGIISKVQAMSFDSGPASKITLMDESGYVLITFFENVMLEVGQTLTAIGLKIWINNKSGHKELSVQSTCAYATGQFKASVALRQRVQSGNYEGLSNASSVTAGPLTTVEQLQQLAQRTNQTVSGTVELYLDGDCPSTNPKLSYLSCQKCLSKIIFSEDPLLPSELGPYVHEKDGGHRSTSYDERYLFPGRFREPCNPLMHVIQVDNIMAEGIFRLTAEAMGNMEDEERVKYIKEYAEKHRKYNIKVMPKGEIISSVLTQV
jgi:hypothetical protein